MSGAMVDAQTGASFFLPFIVCNWVDVGEPLEFQKHSRLLIVNGQIGEDGPKGTHYFEFTGTELKQVSRKRNLFTMLFDDEDDVAEIEPAAGPAGSEKHAANSGGYSPDFDSNGNLSAVASSALFQKILPSLTDATGSNIYFRKPFPDTFMGTGYFREEDDILLFVNPNFGFVILFERGHVPHAIGVTELFSILGEEPKGDKSHLHARFIHLNTYTNKLIVAFKKDPAAVRNRIKDTARYRDRNTNISFLSSPILRAANSDVISCYSDLNPKEFSSVINTNFEKFSGYKENLSMTPIDLVPLPDDKGMLIFTDVRSRSLYALAPLQRQQGKCKFFPPSFILQN